MLLPSPVLLTQKSHCSACWKRTRQAHQHNCLIYLTGKSIKQRRALYLEKIKGAVSRIKHSGTDDSTGRVGGGRDYGIRPKSGDEINHFEQPWTSWLDSMGNQQHYAKNHPERTNLAAHRSGTPTELPLLVNYQKPHFTSASWCRWMVPSGQKMFCRSSHNWRIFISLKIHLVQVVQTPEMARQMPPAREDIDLSNRVVARNREEAERYLEQVKSRSYLEGIAVQTHLITSDNAAVALHQLGEQEHIDMVTLSAHGYSGNHQWPYGSMVNNFILYGKVPLLIVQDLPAKQEQKPLESVIKRTRRALTYADCPAGHSFRTSQIQTQIDRLREFAHRWRKRTQ